MKSEMKKATVLSYICILVNIGLTLLFTPYMIDKLGAAEYGIYSFINNLILYFSIMDLGLGNALTKYASKYMEEKNHGKLASMCGLFLIIYTIIGILALILGLFLYTNFGTIFNQSLTPTEIEIGKNLMLVAMINLAISFPLSIYSSVITAYEKFTFLNGMKLLRYILNPCLMTCLLFFGGKSLSLVIATLAVNLILNVIHIVYMKRKIKLNFSFHNFDFSVLKEMLVYSAFIFLNVLADKIFWNTDQVILALKTGSKSIAVYSISNNFITMFVNFTSVISAMCLPKFTKMLVRKSSEKEISNTFIRFSRIQFLICSYLLAGFIILGKDFILFWVGKDYIEAYYAASLIMIGLLFGVSQNVGMIICEARNQHRFRSLVKLITAFFNIVISYILAPKYGVIGISFATFITHVIGIFGVNSFYLQKRVHLDVKEFWKSLRWNLLLNIIFITGGFYLYSLVPLPPSFVKLIVGGIIYTIVYGSCIYFTMNQYEKNMLNQTFYKIKKKLNKAKKA